MVERGQRQVECIPGRIVRHDETPDVDPHHLPDLVADLQEFNVTQQGQAGLHLFAGAPLQFCDHGSTGKEIRRIGVGAPPQSRPMHPRDRFGVSPQRVVEAGNRGFDVDSLSHASQPPYFTSRIRHQTPATTHRGHCVGVANAAPNDHVQSAAAQDVDHGSWLGPPLDCNSLFVGTARPRPVCPRATVAPPADGHLTPLARRAAIFFLERRSAMAEPGRDRTLCFAGGPPSSVAGSAKVNKKIDDRKMGTSSGLGGSRPFFLSSWVFVSSVPVPGVLDFSAAPDVRRRTILRAQ